MSAFEVRNPGLYAEVSTAKLCPFCLICFGKEEVIYFASRRQDWLMLSTSHVLCFACTDVNAVLKAPWYFILSPHFKGLVPESSFVQGNRTQRNVFVQTEVCVWNGTKTRPAIALLILKRGY